MIPGDWSAASGYEAGLRIAELGATAVFCSNDEMALGMMRALGERDRCVPDDVSVIGFDDIEIAACFPTPLTTVHQDFDEVGRRCVDLMIRQIEGVEDTPSGVDLVPTKLVIRESTAAPKGD